MNSLVSMQANLADRSWSHLAVVLTIFVRPQFSSSVRGWTRVFVFLALSMVKRMPKHPLPDVADPEAHCEWRRGGERFLGCGCQTCTSQNSTVHSPGTSSVFLSLSIPKVHFSAGGSSFSAFMELVELTGAAV